jgi:WD40 repeat protein
LFIKDGTRIVSASDDKSIRLWDAEKGTELRKIVGHAGSVLCFTLSPDGCIIASGKASYVWAMSNSLTLSPGSEDGAIRLFNIHTGEEVCKNLHGRGDAAITSLKYTPDGAKLICGSGSGAVRLLDGETVAEVTGPLLAHQGVVKGISILSEVQIVTAAQGEHLDLILHSTLISAL